MKKLLRPTTFALLTMALCFTACENGNNSYPKEYLGFEKKAQDFSYQKNTAEAEFQVKIIAVDKTKEDRIVFIESPSRPTKPGSPSAQFFKIKDNKVTIKGGSKSAKATILVYPQKVGTNEYIQLVCRPQNGKSETTQMSIRLAASYQILEKRLPRPAHRLFSIRIFSAVAAIALFCYIGWSTYCYLKPAALQTVSTLADTRTIKLPDGTEVTLNHFSSLTYPEKFKGKHREVDLKGEAYFEVTKNREHSFIVQTESVNVEVLGTHFNVESYPDDPEVKTTLLEGSVVVSNKANSVRMVLKPNESAIYNKVKKSMTLEVSDRAAEEIAWRNGELVFTNLPLQEIARQLSNTFGVNISIADKALQNYRITARFSDGEGLDQILDLLHTVGKFNYSHNNEKITITTKLN